MGENLGDKWTCGQVDKGNASGAREWAGGQGANNSGVGVGVGAGKKEAVGMWKSEQSSCAKVERWENRCQVTGVGSRESFGCQVSGVR